MTTWQGAWRLLRFEGARSWVGLLITMLFFSYVSVVMMPLFNELLEKGGSSGYGWVCDFMYLSILPTMGFLMNRSVMHYWSSDPYTRKLAYLRTLPIGWNAIILARMLQHFVVLSIVALFFFTIQYAMLNELRGLLAPDEYILFALIWYGYALFAGAAYVYFEQTMEGGKYFAVCFAFLLIFALIGVLLWLLDTDLMFKTVEASRSHALIWPAGSLLLGAAGLVLSGLLIRQRNVTRNLLH
ncbi:hypothetical protein [Paenibacillus montanisoli]|uniref:ABC transporter permease n=1 Tax=Paenibacillus montanisoli TaxID=2081970 RepID=A0A328TX13_9BACL|nr:hypothetical protein [Paenibacillus montanisoli]RAP75019.1 hypothetical protein DL346_16630 [Paenibacillus montanisoli]